MAYIGSMSSSSSRLGTVRLQRILVPAHGVQGRLCTGANKNNYIHVQLKTAGTSSL